MKREVLDGVPKAVIARRYGVGRQSVYNVLNAVPQELQLFAAIEVGSETLQRASVTRSA